MLKVVQSRVCFNIFQIFTFHDLRKLYTLVVFFFCYVYSGDIFLWSAKKKKKKKKVACLLLLDLLFLFPFFISRTISVRPSHLIDKNKNDPTATF